MQLHRAGEVCRGRRAARKVRGRLSVVAVLHAGAIRPRAGLPESGRQAKVAQVLRSGDRGVAPLLGSQGRDAVDPRDLRFAGRRRRLFRLRRQGRTGERPDGPFARLAVVRRGTETLPRRTAGGCREVAAQLCAELSEGVLPDRRALLFERLLPPLGRARGGHRDAHGARRPGDDPVHGRRAGEALRDDLCRRTLGRGRLGLPPALRRRADQNGPRGGHEGLCACDGGRGRRGEDRRDGRRRLRARRCGGRGAPRSEVRLGRATARRRPPRRGREALPRTGEGRAHERGFRGCLLRD